MVGQNLAKKIMIRNSRWLTCPYMVKTFKRLLSRTTVPIRLIFCMKLWGTFLYEIAKLFRPDHKQTLSGWGKVGKKDAKFQVHEPFELESLFFIGILNLVGWLSWV